MNDTGIKIAMTLVLIFNSMVVASSPVFEPSADYPVGMNPLAVSGADFDSDLDIDLAVVNYYDSTVSVLLNNGDGTFQAAVNYISGPYSRDVVIIDVSGDEIVDLAVLDVVGPSILIGNGDGTFQDAVHYSPLGSPSGRWAIAGGDVDNDTDVDLAVVNWSSDGVSVYRNDGSGAFAHVMSAATGDNPRGIIVTDLDGDYLADLLVMNIIGHSLSVNFSHSTYFDAPVHYATTGQQGDFACVDINGDSDPDLVATIGGTFGGYDILIGNGDGSFGSAAFTDSVGYLDALEVIDVDGGTGPDIIAIEVVTDSVVVFLNDGTGSFPLRSSFVAGGAGSGAYCIHAADFNGDTYNDVAVGNYNLNSVTVLLNNGVGGFPTAADDEDGSLAEQYNMSQNYPNPFNPATTIEYSLSRRGHVAIHVYNVAGQKVRVLVDRDQQAGSYAVSWDGMDDSGNPVATGVYLYRLEAGDHVETKQMLLVK